MTRLENENANWQHDKRINWGRRRRLISRVAQLENLDVC